MERENICLLSSVFNAEADTTFNTNGKMKDNGEVLIYLRKIPILIEHTQKWRYFCVFFHA